MAKFSTVIADVKKADGDLADAKSALAKAQGADSTAHGVVVSALHGAPGSKAALPQADGSVIVYSLNPDGTDFITETIPGDFDFDDTAPTP